MALDPSWAVVAGSAVTGVVAGAGSWLVAKSGERVAQARLDHERAMAHEKNQADSSQAEREYERAALAALVAQLGKRALELAADIRYDIDDMPSAIRSELVGLANLTGDDQLALEMEFVAGLGPDALEGVMRRIRYLLRVPPSDR